jgi:hypothetical protein
MKGRLAILAGMLLAVLLSASSALSPLTPAVAAQHEQDHGAGQAGTFRNAIRAQAAPGLVRMESIRFT